MQCKEVVDVTGRLDGAPPTLETVAAVLAAVAEGDGPGEVAHSVEVRPGYRVTLALEVDEWRSPLDAVNDCAPYGWGTVALADESRPGRRPDWFTDRGEVIETVGYVLEPYARVLWEPPPDVDPDDVRPYVLAILERGTYVAVVEIQRRCEMDGWHIVDSGAIGGLEPDPKSWGVESDYLADIVGDILSEITPDGLELWGVAGGAR